MPIEILSRAASEAVCLQNTDAFSQRNSFEAEISDIISLPKESEDIEMSFAVIRACDMAIYNHSGNSKLYGTLADLITRYAISTTGYPSENLWKAPLKTAGEIHSRFQSREDTRSIRESSDYTEIGEAVVEYNGQTFVAEVLIN